MNDLVKILRQPGYNKRSATASDLVKRLRSIDCAWSEDGELAAQAADEIEQLRHRLHEVGLDWQVKHAEIERLEKELAESQAREAALVKAIDEEMVMSHLGVFNKDDDPVKAITLLMEWSQGVGEYFIKEQLADSQAREAKLRVVLNEWIDDGGERGKKIIADSYPYDDTALKEYRKKVLMEAADKDWWDKDVAAELRKMAGE